MIFTSKLPEAVWTITLTPDLKRFNKYITSLDFYLSVSTCMITAHLPHTAGLMYRNRNKASHLHAEVLKA